MGAEGKRALFWAALFVVCGVLLSAPFLRRSAAPASSPGAGFGSLTEEPRPGPLPKPEELGIVLPKEPPALSAPWREEPPPAHLLRSEPSGKTPMDEEIERLEKLGIITY